MYKDRKEITHGEIGKETHTHTHTYTHIYIKRYVQCMSINGHKTNIHEVKEKKEKKEKKNLTTSLKIYKHYL